MTCPPKRENIYIRTRVRLLICCYTTGDSFEKSPNSSAQHTSNSSVSVQFIYVYTQNTVCCNSIWLGRPVRPEWPFIFIASAGQIREKEMIRKRERERPFFVLDYHFSFLSVSTCLDVCWLAVYVIDYLIKQHLTGHTPKKGDKKEMGTLYVTWKESSESIQCQYSLICSTKYYNTTLDKSGN